MSHPSGHLRAAVTTLRTNSRYRRLYGARVISIFGNQFTNLALAFGVLSLPHTSASSLGVIFAAESTANVLFLLLGGVLGDRFRRDLLIGVADLLSGLAVGAIAWLFATHHATVVSLMVLAFVAGGAVAVRMPALAAVMSEIVPAPERQGANALLRVTTNTATVVAPAVAGVIVSTAGFVPAFLVDATSYLASIFLVTGMRLSRPTRDDAEGATSVLRELARGWSAFVKNRWVVVIVGGFMGLNAAFTGVLVVLGPVVMHQHFDGAASWSQVLTVAALGSVGGSVVALRLRPQRPMVTALLGCFPGALFGLVLIGPLPLAAIAIAAALVAVGFDIFGVLWDTSLQLHITGDLLARVSSYDQMGSFLAIPIGLSVVGWAASATSVGATLIGCVVLSIVMVAAMVLHPAIRRMTNDGPDVATEPAPV